MAVIEKRLKAAAFNKFHNDVVEAVFFAGVENHNDIRMGQEPRGARFGLKASQKLGAREAGALGAEFDSLNGDRASDDGVGRFVDHTHGAPAEFADNFVTPGLRNRRHGYVRHREDTPSFPYLFSR